MSELQTVEDELFLAVADILAQRQRKNDAKRKVALGNKTQVLLAGNLFCAHCGQRLSSYLYKDEYMRKDGTKSCTEEMKYMCYYRAQKKNDCDGASTYKAEVVDGIVVTMVKRMLEGIRQTPKDLSIKLRLEQQIDLRKEQQKEIEAKRTRKTRELDRLQDEIGKCLLGESKFSADVLSAQIERVKKELDTISQELVGIARAIEDQSGAKDKLDGYFDRFVSWADEFEHASMDRQRMIICELFDRIEVGKGYYIDITVNANYRQFLSEYNEQAS